MFVSLRVGLFIRVLVVTALVAGALMLALGARTRPSATQPGGDGSAPESVPATEAPAAPPREIRYRVSGTGGAGLNVRACPDVDCVKVGELDEGATFAVTCWRQGPAVAGNAMWLAGTVDGREGFASARYLRPFTGVAAPACAEEPLALAG
ncbi:hypothetical protein B0I33_109124 [Prauserella shujinwangii]|uniref:SH3 domain-containing protein n=1 Tax=Prauserella shujinwangii TaxID=1453103 RepID=A0A2T0LQ59_9PSEU|nr:SH3 domain-containing protein [Prauserella shujinwangii]PRX45461.1 hypothetical protein B0I33_109124 [Prauserella shujinwangii]